MALGVDFEAGPLDETAAWSAGVRLLLCYIAPVAWGWPKAVSKAQLTAWQAYGFYVQLIWEANTNNWQGGASQGHSDGLAAMEALRELGYLPPWIVLAFDMSIDPSQFPLCLEYAQAFYVACPIAQIPYAESALIRYLQVHSTFTAGGWKTESESFPSDPTADLWLDQQPDQGIPNIGVPNDLDTINTMYWQAPAPQEGKCNMETTDPETGGTLYCDPAGEVYTDPLDGPSEAKYCGGMNTLPASFQLPAGYAINGFAAWKDQNNQWGYKMTAGTPSGLGQPLYYRFPRDGSSITVKIEAPC